MEVKVLREGQQFAHYRIVHRLKSGGMGEVYLADDVQLRRHVAIKVIRTDTSHYFDTDIEHEAARLFLREMQAIGQLEHRYILSVYDSGEEYLDGTTYMYMVMPYRPEGSLTDWLRKWGKSSPLLPRDVERIVKQASSALQHAHNNHIVHQDVKPSNFLIYGDAENPGLLNLQLADFGVAKFMTMTSESLSIRGTPIYMAPEQWDGYPAPATDQYALAVMAYELLTGRPTFVGNTHQHLWNQHHNVPPLPPSSINPRISRELDDVLLRALSKDPEERFSSISEFARAFREAVLNDGKIISITPTQKVASRREVNPTILPTSPAFEEDNIAAMPPPRQNIFTSRAFLQFGAVLALIAMSMGLVFYFANNPRPGPYISHAPTNGSTRIASANTATTGATTSTQTHSTATGQATTVNSTATAQAYATATAISATATVQAIVNATATAYATAVAFGKLALDDSLQDNNKGNGWDITPIAGGAGCVFTGGAYHSVVSQQGYFSTCFAQSTSFSNFSYQVQMTFLSGNQGGIAFRADSGKGAFYYFYINRNGTYTLAIYDTYNPIKILSQGPSSAIKAGLNETNLIAVVANGSTIDLYINMQHVNSVTDNTYSQGQIGVIADDTGNATEVVFSNAKVWTF